MYIGNIYGLDIGDTVAKKLRTLASCTSQSNAGVGGDGSLEAC